jgi:hypothetical protein
VAGSVIEDRQYVLGTKYEIWRSTTDAEIMALSATDEPRSGVSVYRARS